MNISLVIEKYEKMDSRWALASITLPEIIDRAQYNNIISSSPFFRKLGGSERATWGYTSDGYRVVKLVSISPDRENKTIRHFIFSND